MCFWVEVQSCFDGDVHERVVGVAWRESVGAYKRAFGGVGEGVMLVFEGPAGESCSGLFWS